MSNEKQNTVTYKTKDTLKLYYITTLMKKKSDKFETCLKGVHLF